MNFLISKKNFVNIILITINLLYIFILEHHTQPRNHLNLQLIIMLMCCDALFFIVFFFFNFIFYDTIYLSLK